MSVQFRFCPYCASPLKPFEDDDTHRERCVACGFVHYRNPTAGVAVVLVEDGKLLLGTRRRGGWCIPCGHIEWDESVEVAAMREFAEETGLRVQLEGILSVQSNFHDPARHTVGIWFRGRRIDGTLRAGGDLNAVDFHPLDELPELRFPTDRAVAEQLKREYELT